MAKKIIEQLVSNLRDARKRTLELVAQLDSEQMMGPKLATINPLLWEIGHVAYFHEFWTLRHLDGADSILPDADTLYDSINIAHETRWDLPILSQPETLDYMQQVLDAEIARLQETSLTKKDIYLTRYATFHEDMHTEAFTYTRQTLAYPRPTFSNTSDDPDWDAGPLKGDANIPGGNFILGANADTDFCFDNEKWAHAIEVAPFKIARAATTNQQFAEFINAEGYEDSSYWDEEGWTWLQSHKLTAPVYWKKDTADNWQVRQFDQWQPLKPHNPVIHISWYEAKAWCRWAQRRLPTEAEWEMAASMDSDGRKRLYPWGNTFPETGHTNLDGRAMGTIDVGALPDGDSVFGCRQMIGNVWEWTEDTFNPYPGFEADMYQDYSQPLFGKTRVLKGGAWTTRGRMLRNTWRNYYGPDRNDVFAGFRSCAL